VKHSCKSWSDNNNYGVGKDLEGGLRRDPFQGTSYTMVGNDDRGTSQHSWLLEVGAGLRYKDLQPGCIELSLCRRSMSSFFHAGNVNFFAKVRER
jgi:hypothetical protein